MIKNAVDPYAREVHDRLDTRERVMTSRMTEKELVQMYRPVDTNLCLSVGPRPQRQGAAEVGTGHSLQSMDVHGRRRSLLHT